MPNDFDPAIVVETVAEQALTTLGVLIASAAAFSFDVSPNPVKPGAGVLVDLVTDGDRVRVNPANFEEGNTTKETRNVVVNQYSKSIHVTQQELNHGHRLETLVRKSLQIMGEDIQDVLFAPMTVANFPDPITVDGDNFVKADLKTVYKECKDYPTKNLLLDGLLYADLIPHSTEQLNPMTQGAYGYASILQNNRWDGAEANVLGFCGAMDALAVATGEPVMETEIQNDLTMYETVELPNGVTLYVSSWISRATRTRWMSMDVMVGSALGDPAQGRLIMDA